MWRMREIPQELEWTIVVLLPKGNTNTQELGLIDTLWKVVEALIDSRLCPSLQLHDVLHGLMDGRGKWTAKMELKLTKEIASRY